MVIKIFKAVMKEPKLLRDAISSIYNLITEGIFKVNPEGIHLVAADPAMVALVDLKIMKSAFDKFEADKEEKLGINIESLSSILKRASHEDQLTLELKEGKLALTLSNDSVRKFYLPLLNIDEDEVPSTDKLAFDVSADLKTSALMKGIGDASIIGSSVTIKADKDKLVIESEGDSSKVHFEISRDSNSLIDIKGEKEAKSMFSLDYLIKIAKSEKLSDTVSLNLGSDFPMRIDFKVPDKLELGFILAPRIEED